MKQVTTKFERVAGTVLCGVLSIAAPLNMCAQDAVSAPQPALRLDIPHSSNPFNAYRATLVAPPNLTNSVRIDTLVHNGVLELSLNDAILLALENNLDIAIARYNLPIAQADVMRTKAGSTFRGVNAGVVQNTPGGGSSGLGSSSGGAGVGGTTGGAGGAGTGANGLVSSTLGAGTNVSSYDPDLSGQFSVEHSTQPVSNQFLYGVPSLQQNSINGSLVYSQAFPTGTTFSARFLNDRITTNNVNTVLNPELDTSYRVQFQQQLLAGFGLGPNMRFIRIAKNNLKISDEAFKLQIASTITQIANLYWDLVAAYEDEQVKNRSLDFARQSLETSRKQLNLNAIPAMDVLKAEGEVASREQDETIAKSVLRYQELLIKNALTKSLDDPILEAMPVRPTDQSALHEDATHGPMGDLIQQALQNRIDITLSNISLENQHISSAAARNALLPTVSLTGYYAGSGLAGLNNPKQSFTSSAPLDYGGAVRTAFNNSSPDYYVGLSVDIPIRNRVAKADQYRSELETRQAELRLQQLKKQIRIEVRNAQYALEQSEARVVSARKARDLSQKTFEIMGKEQELGAGSNLQTLTAQRDLSVAESALVAALTAYQKAKIELDRSVGSTLDSYSISIESAKAGVAQTTQK